ALARERQRARAAYPASAAADDGDSAFEPGGSGLRHLSLASSSSGGGTRTHNFGVNSAALCQLSYPGSSVVLPRTACFRACRNRRHTVLYLGVAIRAQKNALPGLRAQLLKRDRHALGVDRMPL